MTATLDGVTAVKRTTVAVAGGDVVVSERGNGPALVVLHHEIGSPGWLPFYEGLSTTHRVLVPDLPGYGESTRPDWARHPRDLAIIVELLLDELAVESMDLVGLGFGGWVAAEMATMNQRRLKRLVLVNPYGLQPRSGQIVDQFVMSHEEFVQRGFAEPGAFERVFTAVPSVDQLELWDVHREMTTRIAWKPYMFNPALSSLLASVRTPTMVVSGSHDAVAPLDCSRRFAEILPNGRLTTIEGAGHFAEMECPEAVATTIETFTREGR